MNAPLPPSDKDPRQVAIEALAEGSTISAAARRAGMHRRSLHRLLADDPGFRAELEAARRGSHEAARSALAGAASEACAVLRTVMRDDLAPHSARVRAAEIVLGRALGPVDAVQVGQALDTHRQLLEASLGGRAEVERVVLGGIASALGLAAPMEPARAPLGRSTAEGDVVDVEALPAPAGGAEGDS